MNQDTMRLLQECNAGAKMGIKSLNDVMDDVCDPKMRKSLMQSRSDHKQIEQQTAQMLHQSHADEKEPDKIATAMSWMKTNAKMAMGGNDSTIANLVTDGCNMGVTSISRYLNDYEGADQKAKSIAKELIEIEERLVKDLQGYL